MRLSHLLVLSAIALVMANVIQAFAGEKAYIANQNSGNVSVIDIDSAQVVSTISVGFQPTSVAATENGTRVFVLNEGDKTISVINTSSDKVIDTLDISFTFASELNNVTDKFVPKEIVASPSGDTVYVATNSIYRPTGPLAVDVASGNLTDVFGGFNPFQVPNERHLPPNIDISPNGDFFYVQLATSIAKVNATTLELVGIFELFSTAFVVTDSGETLYNNFVAEFTKIDIESFIMAPVLFGDVSLIDLNINFRVNTPVTISPDSKTLYVISSSVFDFSNPFDIPDFTSSGFVVAALDIENKELLGTAPVGLDPSGIDITSDGKKLVVPNTSDNTVTIIDAQSMQVLNTTEVGPTPRAFKRFISNSGL